ncbi:MAG: peptidoglycan DD-metalloendopeptidase family protein [Candidatus Sericytochromatia bacterium]|nr:peptidoglycan DD-metalloendopeptidase family protein [Candidatus Sericytochromatia bacterium]
MRERLWDGSRLLVCFCALIGLFTSPAVARDRRQVPAPPALVVRTASRPVKGLSQAQQQQRMVQQRLGEARRRVRELKRLETTHVRRLTEIQQAVEVTSRRLEDSRFRLTKAQRRLSATRGELRRAQDSFAREQALASNRLRTIHKFRHVPRWEALLTAPDLFAFLTRYQYLRHVSVTDQRLLDRLDRMVADIHEKKQRYDDLVGEVVRQTRSISAQKSEQLEQKESQADLVNRIRSERAAWEAAEEQLERTSRELESFIRRMLAAQRSRPRLGTGRFVWPAKGRITSPYGRRVHPVYRVARPHHGIDFGGRIGSPVFAADTGVVLFSGWYGGYGKVIILDHGASLATLYGHLSGIEVSAGTKVNRGQVIGRIGSTGLSTGPHLHFEVRRNGSPVNPAGYLK